MKRLVLLGSKHNSKDKILIAADGVLVHRAVIGTEGAIVAAASEGLLASLGDGCD